MQQASPMKQALRRIVAAAPEIGLSWSCYDAATEVLRGEPASLYLYGLLAIELLSLAAMRAYVIPYTRVDGVSVWRRLLTLGSAGGAVILLLINSVMMVLFLLLLPFADPRAFILLAVSGTRKLIWRWSWQSSAADPLALNLQVRRSYRAHWIALLIAFLVSLLMNLLVIDDADFRQQFGDALYLAGMSGYFATLAIYLLTGRTPVPEEREEEDELPAGIDPPPFAELLKLSLGQWIHFVPGILLLFFVVGIIWTAVEPAGQFIALPIAIAAGGWLLLAGAARVLDITRQPLIRFGFSRSSTFLGGVLLLWFMSLLVLFFSIPVVLGLLDLEVTPGDLPLPAQAGIGVSLLFTFYLLTRLWPVAVLPFVLPDHLQHKGGIKLAWHMTSGLDGLVYGGLPTAVLLVLPVGAVLLPEGLQGVAMFLVYTILAPFIAVLALERTTSMVERRFDETPQ